MCRVMPTACAIDWNQCSNSSVSISPSRGWLKPDFQTYLALGQSYYFSDQIAQAIDAYGKAAPMAPDGETYDEDYAFVMGQTERDAYIAKTFKVWTEEELLYAFSLDGFTGSEPMIRLDTNGCPAYQGAPLNGSGHWFAPSRVLSGGGGCWRHASSPRSET